MRRIQPTLIAAAAVAMAAGVVLGSLVLPRDVRLQTGTLIEPAMPLPPFELLREDESTLNRSGLEGDWTLLFFGFTHCPDICPATLETLSAVKRSLEREGEPVPRVLFASVDPERDDPMTLAKYVQYFDPEFQGATGSEAAIGSLARSLGIISAKVWDEDGENYTMDHSAAVLLIDPEARLRAVFGPPHRVQTMAHDIAAILAGRAIAADAAGPG